MILYNAGIFSSNFGRYGNIYGKLNHVEQLMRTSNPYHLESYYYVSKEQSAKQIRNEGVKVFLDSGAYSAFSRGAKIDIAEYCDYCNRNADIIEYASVLDIIDAKNKTEAVKGTFNNLKEMERRGVKALPCYHQGEPEEVLEYYIANYDFITLGGLVGGGSVKSMIIWLDRIWHKYLTNDDGTPKLKVHGFGITSLPIMMRYPWYSVDSSTWVQWAANGMIMMPEKYPGQINISNRSSFRKVKGQHYANLAPIETEAVRQEIIRLGGDPDRLTDLYYVRWAWNTFAFPHYLRLRDTEHRSFIPDYVGLFDMELCD